MQIWEKASFIFCVFQIWLRDGQRAMDVDYYKGKPLSEIVQLGDQVIYKGFR